LKAAKDVIDEVRETTLKEVENPKKSNELRSRRAAVDNNGVGSGIVYKSNEDGYGKTVVNNWFTKKFLT